MTDIWAHYVLPNSPAGRIGKLTSRAPNNPSGTIWENNYHTKIGCRPYIWPFCDASISRYILLIKNVWEVATGKKRCLIYVQALNLSEQICFVEHVLSLPLVECLYDERWELIALFSILSAIFTRENSIVQNTTIDFTEFSQNIWCLLA